MRGMSRRRSAFFSFLSRFVPRLTFKGKLWQSFGGSLVRVFDFLGDMLFYAKRPKLWHLIREEGLLTFVRRYIMYYAHPKG